MRLTFPRLLLATLALASACCIATTATAQTEAVASTHSVESIAESIQLGPLDAESASIDSSVVTTGALFALRDDVPLSVGGPHLQLLPQGLIYRTYLAGVKESRFGGVWNYDNGNGRILDVTLGGQAPLLRYGSLSGTRPEGWQIGLEGAGQVRLDRDEESDVEATDYRFGVPITWGDAIHQTKFAFYHLSSHLGDEFLLKQPTFPRLNYSQNVLVYGHSLYPVDNWRVYGEVGFGVADEIAKPWQFQFGLEWAPERMTGFRGAPFFAANAHLREEVDFGGSLTAQTGWAWRSSETSGLFRLGLQYYTGKNEQFSLYDDSEQKAGFGIWYDF
ncbi:MAG: DUF1207 domain-containing protein [Pirellulales bacterium]|nr:DUF1207 domain-containing protein [Pirellulales bacterium]